MKFIQKILAVAGLIIATALPASAQLDIYGGTKTLSLGFVEGGAKSTTWSNSVVDLTGLGGVGKIVLFSGPDNTAGVNTFSISNSVDNTNWTLLSNVFISVPTSEIKTNNVYGSAIAITQTNLLHGSSITTPTSATAGFATTYLATPVYTNNATIALTNAGVAEISFNIQDAGKYIRLGSVTGSSGTNYSFGGVVEGRKTQ